MDLASFTHRGGVLMLAILASACVYTPESGASFDSGQSITFRGLASNPGATIQLYGFNKSTGAWEQLAEGAAKVTPHTFRNNRRFYTWELELTLEDHEDWRCFLSPTCEFTSDGDYEARFQLREVDGAIEHLYTFDQGGFRCWWDSYRAGEDLLSAYWPCRAEIYDELRINVPIVL